MKTNTPTPNEVLTELAGVLHRIPQAHRDIIVTAVNSHEAMLETLKSIAVQAAANCINVAALELQVKEAIAKASA